MEGLGQAGGAQLRGLPLSEDGQNTVSVPKMLVKCVEVS